jgi:hypothetical protein
MPFSPTSRGRIFSGVTRGVALEHCEYIQQSATRKKFCPLETADLGATTKSTLPQIYVPRSGQ